MALIWSKFFSMFSDKLMNKYSGVDIMQPIHWQPKIHSQIKSSFRKLNFILSMQICSTKVWPSCRNKKSQMTQKLKLKHHILVLILIMLHSSYSDLSSANILMILTYLKLASFLISFARMSMLEQIALMGVEIATTLNKMEYFTTRMQPSVNLCRSWQIRQFWVMTHLKLFGMPLATAQNHLISMEKQWHSFSLL